jgi:hypothetical protein
MNCRLSNRLVRQKMRFPWIFRLFLENTSVSDKIFRFQPQGFIFRVHFFENGSREAGWGRPTRRVALDVGILGGRESMPVYSYFLFGGPKRSPLQFELEGDSSAVALSICILRDEPDIEQVWIIEDREPDAVRVRHPDNDIGVLIELRAPMVAAANACASGAGRSSACA